MVYEIWSISTSVSGRRSSLSKVGFLRLLYLPRPDGPLTVVKGACYDRGARLFLLVLPLDLGA